MRKLAKNSHKDLQPSTSRLYMESGRRRAFPQARLNLSSTSAAPEQQSNNLIRALPDSQIPAAGRTAVNVAVAARLIMHFSSASSAYSRSEGTAVHLNARPGPFVVRSKGPNAQSPRPGAPLSMSRASSKPHFRLRAVGARAYALQCTA